MSNPTNWRDCAEAGMSLSEAARHLGKRPSSGGRYAKRHGFSFAKKSADLTRERLRRLHADPEFAERHRERIRRLHADPARNPLVLLSAAERADYNVCKRSGMTRAEALRAIGREDLLAPGGGTAHD